MINGVYTQNTPNCLLQMSEFLIFSLYFHLPYQEQYPLETCPIKSNILWSFTCKAFRCMFHFCIKNCFFESITLCSSNKACNIMYFIFNLFGFCIWRGIGSHLNNARYLLANFVTFVLIAVFVVGLVRSVFRFQFMWLFYWER